MKINVLFFIRGTTKKDNTKEVWFYDLRTNMQNFGKTTTLKHEHFTAFVETYHANDRFTVLEKRWNCFTRKQINDKGDSLDLGVIRDDSVLDYENLQDPDESGEEIAAQLEEAVDLIMSVVKELRNLSNI